MAVVDVRANGEAVTETVPKPDLVPVPNPDPGFIGLALESNLYKVVYSV